MYKITYRSEGDSCRLTKYDDISLVQVKSISLPVLNEKFIKAADDLYHASRFIDATIKATGGNGETIKCKLGTLDNGKEEAEKLSSRVREVQKKIQSRKDFEPDLVNLFTDGFGKKLGRIIYFVIIARLTLRELKVSDIVEVNEKETKSLDLSVYIYSIRKGFQHVLELRYLIANVFLLADYLLNPTEKDIYIINREKDIFLEAYNQMNCINDPEVYGMSDKEYMRCLSCLSVAYSAACTLKMAEEQEFLGNDLDLAIDTDSTWASYKNEWIAIITAEYLYPFMLDRLVSEVIEYEKDDESVIEPAVIGLGEEE